MKKILLTLALFLVAACSGPRVPGPATPRAPVAPDGIFGSHTHGYADLPATAVRSDGTVPFTATVGGVAPVAGSDLSTKAYVDSVVGGAPATKKVLVSAMDTTEDYLDPTLVVGSGVTKTIINGGANETLQLDLDFGSGAGQVCEGNDARLTDGRAPTGVAGGDLNGTYPNPTFLYDRVRKDVFTTKGDLLVTWAASDVRRLAVGATNGMILSVDSTTGPGVAWKTVGDVFPHTILSHTDGSGEVATKGALIVGNAGADWTSLTVGADGKVLMAASAETQGVKWDTIPVQTSTLLDGTVHTDTLAGSATRGDVIVGNATPKWARLAKGTAYQRLAMDSGGNDPTWTSQPHSMTAAWMSAFVPPNQAAFVLKLVGAGAGELFVPVMGGTVTGFSFQVSGGHTLGTITFRVKKNGVADGTLVLTSGTTDTKGYTTGTGVTFAAGDDLAVECDTSPTWDGVADVIVYLWVRYDA